MSASVVETSALRRPFAFGPITLPSNIFYAPLAGCSDLPFRQMVQAYRPGLYFCEMVKIEAVVRHDPHTARFLDYTPDMHPIGAQICGSKPRLAKEAAKMIEDLGFDVIDLNCGCPVDKVVKDGSGSGLLKNPELIGEILSEMVHAVRIPVSVKIRAGWDEKQINAVEILRIAEQAGATAITIHGRTRQQGYAGKADWDIIGECKRAAVRIIVIGNGDVVDGASAEQLFTQTGCDGILVARGTLGQPWIAKDIERHFLQKPPIKRSAEDVRLKMLEHFQKILSYQNDRQSLLDMRRVGCWYLKLLSKAKSLRIQLNQAKDLQEMMALFNGDVWQSVE